jgi:hypothetical protein
LQEKGDENGHVSKKRFNPRREGRREPLGFQLLE